MPVLVDLRQISSHSTPERGFQGCRARWPIYLYYVMYHESPSLLILCDKTGIYSMPYLLIESKN